MDNIASTKLQEGGLRVANPLGVRMAQDDAVALPRDNLPQNVFTPRFKAFPAPIVRTEYQMVAVLDHYAASREAIIQAIGDNVTGVNIVPHGGHGGKFIPILKKRKYAL